MLSFLSFSLFLFLSKYEDRQAVRNLDFAVTVKVQDAIDRSTRLRLKALTANVLEGSVFFAGPLMTSLAAVMLTGFVFRKRKRWAFLIPLSFALIVGVELVAKEMVHHPPPPFFMIKNPASVFPKYYVSEEFSFPSGHAARAMFLAITSYVAFGIGHLALRKRLLVGLALGIYVGLVSVSKIYLGHHWFSDVVGGLLVGGAFGIIPVYLIGRGQLPVGQIRFHDRPSDYREDLPRRSAGAKTA